MDIAGLALACISQAVEILRYFHGVIQDSKEFGEDVRQITTRITTESARLSAFREFLENKNFADGKSRFEMLPEPHRLAVSGMVQELLIMFGTYTTILNKFDLRELQAGRAQFNSDKIADGDMLAQKGREASWELQQHTKLVDKAYWGFFKKKNILNIVAKLEEWNNKLQNFLLCGLCFLDETKLAVASGSEEDRATLKTLRLTTGLRLRSIITGTGASSIEILQQGYTLSPAQKDGKLRTLTTSDSTTKFYAEYKPYKPRRGSPQEPAEAMTKRVLRLGNLLCQPRAADTGFHTLQCKFIVNEKVKVQGRDSFRFAFLFSLPSQASGEEPIDLLSAINPSSYTRPTLGERFKIAKTLVDTVFQLHSVGWLHKSIRTENIVFFPRRGSPGSQLELDYSQQYMVGFEFSRDENDTSTTEQDDVLERNIYRHPDRQGPPDTRFSVLHDIYSVGVVLLEVGLWRSVIDYDPDFPEMLAEDIKETLEKHAEQRLPHYMGRAYTDATLACLRGSLDSSGNKTSGAITLNLERQREAIQLAFHKQVMGRIECGRSLIQADCGQVVF